MKSGEATVQFVGRLCNGELTQSIPVVVTLESDGLVVTRPDRSRLAFWKFRNLRAAAKFKISDSDLFLSNTQTPRATLLIEGEHVAENLVRRAPQIAPNERGARLVKLALLLLMVLVSFASLVFIERARYPKLLAQIVPFSAADALGKESIKVFFRIGSACTQEPGLNALRKMLTRVAGAHDYNGHPFDIHVTRSPMSNAFALPGGHIMLLSGLINRVKSPDELAGILAHEIGHSLNRDPLALFVRTSGANSLIDLFTSRADEDDAASFSATLLQIRYSQDIEKAADINAIGLMRDARLSPKATGEFFTRHAVGSRTIGSGLLYLGTHPWTDERAKLYLSDRDSSTAPIVTEKEWADIQAVCNN